MAEALQPVPGRECGDCNVCCVALFIDDPILHKPAGVRCTHLMVQGGCAIYAARPGKCAVWYCGWRYLSGLPDHWRPDLCGVLVDFTDCDQAGYPATGFKLSVAEPQAILQPFVLDFIARMVGEGRPVYFTYRIGVGGGFKTFLNERARAPAAARNLAGLADILRSVMVTQSELKAAEQG